jgi:hypothetical protein
LKERRKNEQQTEADEREDYIEAQKMESQERIERERFQSQKRIELARLKAEFAKALLENARPLRGITRADNFERLVGLISSTTEDALSDIARDTRVKDGRHFRPVPKNSNSW